jgi:hypothetical protein
MEVLSEVAAVADELVTSGKPIRCERLHQTGPTCASSTPRARSNARARTGRVASTPAFPPPLASSKLAALHVPSPAQHP